MLTNCFTPLDLLPLLSQKYIDEGLLADYQLPLPEVNGKPMSRSVSAPTTFASSDFAQDLSQKLNTTVRAKLIRFGPYSLYDWHSDISPNNDSFCDINFLFNVAPYSMTLFRKQTDTRLTYDIIDCPYVLYQPMLFNVRKQHCIINNGNNFRYLMTVTISNVTFEDAVEFFKTYTIGNY